MSGICTNSTRLHGPGCDHRTLTVVLDGESFTFASGEFKLDEMAWDDDAKRQFILLGLKRRRVAGLLLDDAIGIVTNGDEGNPVKSFEILTQNVTKTNIGISYVNVPIGANGERVLIDFTGCTQYRIAVYFATGGGQTDAIDVRLVKDSDNTVLREALNANGGTAGEKVIDSGWQSLPGSFNSEMAVRLQAKSTATADPVFRRCTLYVK